MKSIHLFVYCNDMILFLLGRLYCVVDVIFIVIGCRFCCAADTICLAPNETLVLIPRID